VKWWPINRRKDEPMPTVPAEGTSIDEARAARRNSEAALGQARARDPEVRSTASRLRTARRDLFAEGMAETFREHRP
jgi:hypothetical protein